jgi:steroid 5-alpha reductase family enzyme
MRLRDLALNLPIALAAAWAWMLVAFAVGRALRRHATVDVFWGPGFLVIYLESLFASHAFSASAPHPWWPGSATLRVAVLVAVALWGLRLAFHLARRQRGAPEDPRYVAILGRSRPRSTWRALRVIYGLQGVLMWFVSMPLQVVAFGCRAQAGILVAGLVVVAVGLFFEAVGDEQLRRFRADPANAGRTLDVGLWRYTRHPNYFGDAVVWTGLYLCAASTPWGWASALSALLMIWLLTSLSGRPMLEAKLTRTRPGYVEYVARTSSFLPRPPRQR